MTHDYGTAERWKRDAIVVEGNRIPHARVVTQTALDRYLLRKLIGIKQWQAGDRLRADHYVAGLSPRTVAFIDEMPRSGGQSHLGDRQMDARKRYLGALTAVGPVGIGILNHVCCHDGTAEEYARLNGVKGKAASTVGMALLRISLDEMVKHYGL